MHNPSLQYHTHVETSMARNHKMCTNTAARFNVLNVLQNSELRTCLFNPSKCIGYIDIIYE